MSCSVSYTETDNGYTPCDQTYDSSTAPPYDTFVSPITKEAFNQLGAKCESKNHCCVQPDAEGVKIVLVALSWSAVASSAVTEKRCWSSPCRSSDTVLWIACFHLSDFLAPSSLTYERKYPPLFSLLSALLMSDRCVLSKTMLDTWNAGWAVSVPLN